MSKRHSVSLQAFTSICCGTVSITAAKQQTKLLTQAEIAPVNISLEAQYTNNNNKQTLWSLVRK
jgi:hypothetical protein